MKYYLAPMEGLTGYVYRNAHHYYYGPWINILPPSCRPQIQQQPQRPRRNRASPNTTRDPVIPADPYQPVGGLPEDSKGAGEAARELNLISAVPPVRWCPSIREPVLEAPML